jgi:hypothetical protein
LILAADGGSTGRISSSVWRRGLRQLLRQLHKLYIWSLSRRLCRALNTLHAFAWAEEQRSASLGFPPRAMSEVLQSDSSDADTMPRFSPSAENRQAEDIPLRVFSIYGFDRARQYSIAPFMRYLGRHAPCLTDVGLSRSTADTAAELITMRGPCRAVDLRDVQGLTDTIVASILKRHRATLRQLALFSDPGVLKYDPQVYMDVLGDRGTPQGAPFAKITSVGLQKLESSPERRAYLAYLFPRLGDLRRDVLVLP